MVNCPNCKRIVRDHCRAIECDFCANWFHLKCTTLSLKDYNYLTVSQELWLCKDCRNTIFPFNNLDESDLKKLSFNSNTNCNCSQNLVMEHLLELPQFEAISSLINVPFLSNSDPEVNLPSQINSKYYSTH